jgi:hypothetical protein
VLVTYTSQSPYTNILGSQETRERPTPIGAGCAKEDSSLLGGRAKRLSGLRVPPL